MSHITRWNESYNRSVQWRQWSSWGISGVMSHIWMNHVLNINKSCHTSSEWVMSKMFVIAAACNLGSLLSFVPWEEDQVFVTHLNESCPKYQLVMSHIWMSQVFVMAAAGNLGSLLSFQPSEEDQVFAYDFSKLTVATSVLYGSYIYIYTCVCAYIYMHVYIRVWVCM